MDHSIYSIGDLVRAVRSIYSGSTEEMPAQDFCRAGDILEVRKVGGWHFPISVAHPYMRPGIMFGVELNEVAPLSPTLLVSHSPTLATTP